MDANKISFEGKTEDKKKFCQIWPDVKAGLLLLQTIIRNPIAKAAVGIVIIAGDSVYGFVCKS
jgi:hypothetical protein